MQPASAPGLAVRRRAAEGRKGLRAEGLLQASAAPVADRGGHQAVELDADFFERAFGVGDIGVPAPADTQTEEDAEKHGNGDKSAQLKFPSYVG